MHSTILAQSLKSITEHLSKHSDLFAQTVVYPSTNFPGRSQENLVGQLLRKKLEPGVESWVEEGRALGRAGREQGAREEDEELDGLWDFAKAYVLPEVAKAAQMSRAKLDEIYDESEEEEEEEEAEQGGEAEKPLRYVDGGKGDPRQPVRDLDAIARFMTTGAVLGS